MTRVRPLTVLLPALLCACAALSGGDRIEVLAKAPSFRARALAIATTRGARGHGAEFSSALAARLREGGIRATALEDSDSVLAGAALGLDVAANPRVLAEIRRATGADGVVFATFDPEWRTLDVAVLDATSGDPVLRATARPRGASFASAGEAASAAARALTALSRDPARAAAAADDRYGDLPMP
jgi:hypothetical protein